MKLHDLGAKNENIAKNRPFCEKVNTQGQYLCIPQFDFNSEKSFFQALEGKEKKNLLDAQYIFT